MNEYLKNLKRIEFTITMACTGKCIHCSEGDHEGCFGHIDADVAGEAVKKICALYGIQSLMTFGGEPLLYSETVCTIKKRRMNWESPKDSSSQTDTFPKDRTGSKPSRKV